MNRERISIELFEHEPMLKRVWENYKKIGEQFSRQTQIITINGDKEVPSVFESIKKNVRQYWQI